MNRRTLIKTLGFAPAAALALPMVACANDKENPAVKSSYSKTDWKKILPPESYAVLFEEATERPGSSPFNTEKKEGLFVCAACYNPLFESSKKYESGTGWPSFFQPIEGGLEKKKDFLLFLPRTEYHCAYCGGHQGHLFDDGPQPTGLRYCNNGVALRFVPKGDEVPKLRS